MQQIHFLNSLAVEVSLEDRFHHSLQCLKIASHVLTELMDINLSNGTLRTDLENITILASLEMTEIPNEHEHQTATSCSIFCPRLFYDPDLNTRMSIVEMTVVVLYNTAAVNHRLYLQSGHKSYLHSAKRSYISALKVPRLGEIETERIGLLLLALMNNLVHITDILFDYEQVGLFYTQLNTLFYVVGPTLSYQEVGYFGLTISMFSSLKRQCSPAA